MKEERKVSPNIDHAFFWRPEQADCALAMLYRKLSLQYVVVFQASENRDVWAYPKLQIPLLLWAASMHNSTSWVLYASFKALIVVFQVYISRIPTLYWFTIQLF